MYEMICLLICVFAVFGGYVALRVAAHALLRRMIRPEPDDCTTCSGCGGCAGCPKNSTKCKTEVTKD